MSNIQEIKIVNQATDEDVVDYDSGISEIDENMVNFSTMSSKEKDEHVKELWRLCFLRSLGGSQIKLSCNKMIKRVVKYGTTKNINAKKASDDMIFENKRESSVIYPDNLFFTYWSILMFFLIIYVAFWMPIQVSFLTAKTTNFLNLNI